MVLTSVTHYLAGTNTHCVFHIAARYIRSFCPVLGRSDEGMGPFADAAQDCLSYALSMSKLKSFKFSLKWRQEQISNSMRLIFMSE